MKYLLKVKREHLTPRCRKIADGVERSLNNPEGTPPDVHLIQIPSGTEKDMLLVYLMQLMEAAEKRTTYVAATDLAVHDTYKNLTDGIAVTDDTQLE